MRRKSIKVAFSKAVPATEWRSATRQRNRERGIWQRRFWEHTIRDEDDYAAHMGYAHFNPVKHGHTNRVRDWPFSSFHRLVKSGTYPVDWAGKDADNALPVGEPA
jgi:putative transposase